MLEIRKPGIATLADSLSAYNELYDGPGIRLLDSFYLRMLSLLPIKRGARLLDVSCGEGSLLGFALRAGLTAFGVDISYSAAEMATRRVGRGAVVVGDGEALPFPNEHFDFVTNVGSIEHYLHPSNGIREIARVLKPGGLACIVLPNLFGLTWNVYWVLRTGSIYVDDQPIQRYATRRHWEELIKANGLEVRRVHGDERPLPRTLADLFWYLKRPRKLLAACVARLIPTNLASSYIFICARSQSTQGQKGQQADDQAICCTRGGGN